MKNNLYQAIFDESNVRWQSLIYEMVRTGKINPWDIDLTHFTKEYLQMIHKLKELNFRVSGKVVLAAAILLKLKTNELGLADFLNLTEEEPDYAIEEEAEFVDEDEQKLVNLAKHIAHNTKKEYKVEPNIYKERTRKVTVFELVSALKKALEVDERRKVRYEKVEIPETKQYRVKTIDIVEKIKDVFQRLKSFIVKYKRNTIEFTKIVPSSQKKDIIWTFVPLLHLATKGKLELHQSEPFGELFVEMTTPKGLSS